MTIYCVILQALTALFLLKTLQCFLRDAPFLSAEPLRPRNEVSKIRHPGQTSELLWNLLLLHLITAWQRRSDRWREAGNGSVMPFTRWEFPRYKFQVNGFQNFFFCSLPKYSNTRIFGTIHEALSKYSVRLFCSETLRKTSISSETLGKQLPRWQWANSSWKKNIVTQQLNSVKMFMPKGTGILSCPIGLRKYIRHTSHEILMTV